MKFTCKTQSGANREPGGLKFRGWWPPQEAQSGEFLAERIKAREQLFVVRLQLNVTLVSDGGVSGFVT